MTLQKVSKEEFYGVIYDRKLDVCVSVLRGPHPYTCQFKFRDGRLFGESRPRPDSWPVEDDYFLAPAWVNLGSKSAACNSSDNPVG